MLNFTVTNQKIIFSGIAVDEIGDPLVSGSANLYLCHFDFNETWQGFTKTAVFEQTDCKKDSIKYSPILDENNNCYIPKDIIKDNGHIRVGIYGVKDEVRMPTVYSSSFLVRVGAVPEGYIPPEEKSLYEQLLEKYNQAFLLIEDLAGGTAGQVLVKESDDDYDFTWHDFSADAPIQNISVNGTVQPIVDKTVNLEVVEPEDGKGLSTNDYTNADKTKLEGIEAGAQVNVQSDWQQTDTTKDDYIKNKPSIVETEEFEQFQQTVEGKFDEVDDELELKADKSTTYTKTEVDEKLDDKADTDTVYTKSQADALLNEKVDKVTGKGLSTNDYDNTEKEKVSEAYSLRHSHANKALLDTYDQSNADIADAVAKKHTHANKSILDTISQTLINTWNTVTGKYEKPTDGIPKSDMTTSVQTSLDNADSALQPDDVQDNVTSVYTDKPLSAKQGKLLNDRLNNVEARGRFLSLWDCVTGKPTTDPETLPYNYKTGDWYRVSNVTASTLYKPSGSSYTGTASTVVETEDVNVGDCYWYDGSSWSLEVNHTSPDAVQDVKVDGTSVVSDGVANIDLNGKVDKVAGKGLSTNDFTNEEKQKVDNALQPSALNNYRTSAEQDVIDNTKVDKVTGKGLSANDYSDTEKQKVADAYADRHTHSNKSILDGITQTLINTWNTVTGKYEKPSSGIPKSDMASAVQTSLEKADSALQSSALTPYRTATAQDVIDNGKVDKVTGKGLSTNDFDNTEKAKVDSALQPTDVKDNLTSTDTNKPLSAKQGKVLNDTLTSQSEAIVTLESDVQGKVDKLTTSGQHFYGHNGDTQNEAGVDTVEELPVTIETWTFTLEDDTTVTKKVIINA